MFFTASCIFKFCCKPCFIKACSCGSLKNSCQGIFAIATVSCSDIFVSLYVSGSVEQFLGQNHLEDYNAQLRLSWEADIWGKIKNEKQASLTALLQTTEAQKAVQTSLINQLVKGYYQLLSLQQMKQVAIENMTLSKHSLTLAKHQYDVGEVSSLAIDQLEAQYLAAAALIPDFEQQIAVQEHALRVLCSDFPHAIALTTPSAEIAYPTYYATGVPADLLRNRPDIKQAELEIKRTAIQANIAHKQLYPSLVITAQMGVNALKASNWFNLPGSLFGTVLGGITQPIFQKRELTTNYELAKLNYEKSALQFRQHMVIAVAEVSDALQGIEKLKQREALTKLRANKLNDAIKHAQLLFKNGEATYLDVITAQSHALSTALEIITIRKATLHAFADLYSALGGGVE